MDVLERKRKIREGGEPKYHEKNIESGKLFARKRIELLCDQGSFVEEGSFANCLSENLPADGVVTGLAKIGDQWVAIMANDSTVKAGSWGARTVEKILRVQENAMRLEIPLFYLVDSAGARLTDQIQMFPGRRGAGRIFYNQANLSGKVPQICVLFGPSAAGGAYIPAFCDVVIMVEGNASMYLGSPRMAEAVIGEKVSLEEMGGARMHCTVSGVGDFLAKDEKGALEIARQYFSYLPANYRGKSKKNPSLPPEKPTESLRNIVPESAARAYDMREVLKAILDRGSFLEIKELYAKEIIVGFGRLDGSVIGIIANQPLAKGGVLFAESANKAARFIQICTCFNLPLLFVEDVPGFMIGSKVEREGIIRAGAKMIHAVSNAKVPKIALIVRKAYGAGLYAMCGPAFDTDCVLALPTAQVAVMGPEPAINAVYYNKMVDMSSEEKKKFIAEKTMEYQKDIDIYRMGSELIVDEILDFSEVRNELAKRFSAYGSRIDDRVRPPSILPM